MTVSVQSVFPYGGFLNRGGHAIGRFQKNAMDAIGDGPLGPPSKNSGDTESPWLQARVGKSFSLPTLRFC